MKVKNVSEKVKMFKKDGAWVNVNPGEVVELPAVVVNSEEGMVEVKEKPKEKDPKKEVSHTKPKDVKKSVGLKKPAKKKPKSREELEKMTKDQLNDYGAVIGLKKLSQRMMKSKMVNSLLRFQRK